MPSTRPYLPRVSLVFDFDDTLASDSIDGILAVMGLERDEWEARWHAPLGDNWDPILKRGRALIRAGRDVERPLTHDLFRGAADRLELFPEVLEMPERVRAEVARVHDAAECEFVVLSSGFVEVIDHTPVAGTFDRVWAGAFHFEDGEAVAVKRVITHPEKSLYLRAYADGLDLSAVNAPGTSDTMVDEHEMHVLHDQMVYVGDGYSDLQAFGFLEGAGGLALAIEKGRGFSAAGRQSPEQRVQNLAPPDYREGSELMSSLLLAAQACAARVALRALSEGE